MILILSSTFLGGRYSGNCALQMCFIDFYDSLRDLIVILVPLASLKRYGLYKGLNNVSGVEFYVI